MECPACHNFVQADFVHCKHCGTKVAPQADADAEIVSGATPSTTGSERQDDDFELGELPEADSWQFSREEGWVPTPRMTGEVPTKAVDQIRWGGFFRRCGAIIIDALVIAALTGLMTGMAYIGYKVGLAAHGRTPNLDNSLPLVIALVWATGILATGYFVMLHTMSGKTIGKALFRLRVVGADHNAIGYGRALLRWLGMLATAPLVLGFLWVLWSREKRAWHDFIAATWVIRQ
jgi:uncharacterized RDD family membrane protein YckC